MAALAHDTSTDLSEARAVQQRIAMEDSQRRANGQRALKEADAARERLRKMIRSRPLVAIGAAAAAGGVVGGLLFSRLGQLACAAAAGFVARELWRREGRLSIDEVVRR
jgi:ElaB/YqjD/DUF883 family membrane-anchored ribosome-binding protein